MEGRWKVRDDETGVPAGVNPGGCVFQAHPAFNHAAHPLPRPGKVCRKAF
jgi:hypothetical protein